jgi:hypothetical protein
MIEAVSGAAEISQYGLYAIVAILCFVVGQMYKRAITLEKEIRDTIHKNHESLMSVTSDSNRAISNLTESIKLNTKAIEVITNERHKYATHFKVSKANFKRKD